MPCHLLASSFSSLFFFPWYLLLGLDFCGVLLSDRTQQPQPSHACSHQPAPAWSLCRSLSRSPYFTSARRSRPPSARAQAPCCSSPGLLSSWGTAGLWQGGHSSIPGPAGAATLLTPSAGQAGAPSVLPTHGPTHGRALPCSLPQALSHTLPLAWPQALPSAVPL